MEDLIRAAFVDGVTPKEFFTEHFKNIHNARLDEFAKLSKCPLIVSFLFEDTDERYTFELSSKGYKVEEGDMIDFPIITIVANESDLDDTRADLLEAALALYASEERLQKQYGRKPMTQDFKDAFESMLGTINVEVTGGNAPIKFKIYLNDYDDAGTNNEFNIKVAKDIVLQMARGELDPGDAQGKFKVYGKMAFALELAGFLQKQIEG